MDWLFNFPDIFDLDTSAIDNAVRSFAVSAEGMLDVIKGGLNGLVNFIGMILMYIPWPVFLLLIFWAGWRIRKSLKSGILYAVLIFLIGAVGLWNLMRTTLSVVLASVAIALVIGIPIGY